MPLSNRPSVSSSSTKKIEYDPSRTISLRPEDAEQSGGLLPYFDATLVTCESETWDYDGSGKYPMSPAIKGIFELDETGEKHPEHWRAGGLDKLAPNPDGTGFMPARDVPIASLRNTTNAFQFLVSVKKACLDAGFSLPADFPANLKALEGIHGHWIRVDQKNRDNLKKEEGGWPRQLIIAETVDRVPWMTKKTVAAPKTVASVPKPNGQDSQENGEALAFAEAVVKVLEEGPVKLAEIGVAAFRVSPKTSPYRQKFIDYTEEEIKEFLELEGSPVKLQGKTVVLK